MALVVAVATDLRERKIYDWLTLPTLIGALLLRWALVGWAGPLGLQAGLLGAVLGLGVFLLLAWSGGMGMGDVKLMAGVGAVLGWEKTLTALVLISLSGGVQALLAALASGKLGAALAGALRLVGRPWAKRALPPEASGSIPYGVAIAVGTFATFLLRGLALWAVVVCLAGPAPAQAESVLHLGVGTQKVLDVRGGIARIAVGDPTIADVRPLGEGQILVVGMREGRTTLLVWRNSGRQDSHLLVVRKVSTEDLADEIRALLGDREGIEVRASGEQVILDGRAYTPEDHRRVQEVVELYGEVRSLVQIAPHALRLLIEELNQALQEAGLRHVHAGSVGASVYVEGSVESQAELRKVEWITRAVGARAENLVTVGMRRMILSEVHFLEVRRSEMKQIGVRFPLDIAGSAAGAATVQGVLPIGEGGVAVGSYEALVEGAGQWSLRAAVDKGHGRLLAQPTLVCASGEQAEFLAGGEVPVPLITQTSSTVEYRKYGVVLRLRPTVDGNGNIVTDIEAEVSELDRAVAVAVGPTIAVPGFRNRSVKTNVTVRNGETIVLSGVYTLDEQKSVSKVPLLGDIPLIGELFKQRTFDEAERELLIFVTPRIVNAESGAVVERIEDMRGRYQQGRGDVGYHLLD